MSFDARSRERLEALGRQLPRKLPVPSPPAAPSGEPATGGQAVERRHPVETEQDPERLFRQLMDVSADGSVPPHLLERLRQLEAPPPAPLTPAPLTPERRRPSSRPRAGDPAQDLYTAFQQLLLEDED
jgi:hypothetical protein